MYSCHRSRRACSNGVARDDGIFIVFSWAFFGIGMVRRWYGFVDERVLRHFECHSVWFVSVFNRFSGVGFFKGVKLRTVCRSRKILPKSGVTSLEAGKTSSGFWNASLSEVVLLLSSGDQALGGVGFSSHAGVWSSPGGCTVCRFLLSAHVDAVQYSIFGLCTAENVGRCDCKKSAGCLRLLSSSGMSSCYVGLGQPGRTWTLPFIHGYDLLPFIVMDAADTERRGSQRSLVCQRHRV